MTRSGVACALLAGALLIVPAAASADCAAWPGEPDPLPAAAAMDPLEQRWAQLRRDELAGLARSLEMIDRLEAHRIWRHAACIAPADLELRAGVERTRPAVLHHVGIRPFAARDVALRRAALASAFAVLDRDALIPSSDQARATPVEFDFEPVDRHIEIAGEWLAQARFRAAVDRAALARAKLARLEPHPAVVRRRARIEMLTATAQIALGLQDDARASVERALRAEPDLELDPLLAPPKLRRLIESARAQLAEAQR